MKGRTLEGPTRPPRLRYAAALLPGILLAVAAFLIDAHQDETGRAQRLADQARRTAANVDQLLVELLEVTAFCATAPALIERLDLASVAENCGRYASRIGAWLVVVETGVTHRQILNTRPNAPAVLPSYPRTEEKAPLIALEMWSRASGAPGIADVFTGIIYPGGIVSAGQNVRLADGRSAMIYVSISARDLSEQLAGLASAGGPTLGLIDPSHRVVAHSVGIDQMMFADAPDWILPFRRTAASGAVLGVPGPEMIGGTFDAGYHPLSEAPGWMAAAFQPTHVGVRLWAPASLPSAVTIFGLLLSGLLIWGIADRDRGARRVADAERQNREKSRLLASFVHDIRSPLISLIESLELIGDGREAAKGQVCAARGSAEALLQLVDDILELSFLGSGELVLHPSPVDLHQLAASLADQIGPLAARKGLELRVELDPLLPMIVEVDRLRLQQVLTNLLTNAVKYTDRGSVTLRVREEGGQAGKASLDLAVIDTGIGLAPADIPRILREYGRLEREAERREPGTGLGLAIVQRILTRMGASLKVESAPGQGSTFSFHLTLPVSTGGEVADAIRPLSGVVVLYAEDEPVIREVTTRRLAEAGAKVICAVDGHDTLDQLDAVTPDLLLIDLQMPGLDGVELIRRLTDIAPARDYPVFVLTSHISGPQAAEARAAGADAVFTKPVQVAALAAAFRARRGDGGRSTPPVKETADPAMDPILDPATFGELVEMIGAPLVSSLVGDFEQTMRNDLSALEAAIEAMDLARTGELAHRCQGLCQIFGATTLAMRLCGIELDAEDGDIADVRAFANGLSDALSVTLHQIRSALRELDAASLGQ